MYLDSKIESIFLKMIPRCGKCGKPINRIKYKLIHSIPSYCPTCGAKISLQQKRDVTNYEIVFCTVVFTIFAITMIIIIQLGLI